MIEQRLFHRIIGSKAFFDSKVEEITSQFSDDYADCEIKSFLALVRLSDERKNRGSSIFDEDKATVLLLKNDNYHGIVDAAHDRLGSLIEEVTTDDAVIFLHNPPTVLTEYLEEQKGRGLIEMTSYEEKYGVIHKPEDFSKNMTAISTNLYGQNNAIEQVSKSMWYLTNADRKKPYVIMLYGGSSLGKTELVRQIAENFYGGKFLEQHLSMFKNERYSYYFFGNQPNRRSLGFDLLERESNLVFLDEIDKCPEYFFSAFYTLFDNTVFIDATYKLDISGLLIVLTSNYANEEEMKKCLGLPIFYRIDKFICFEEFSAETIHDITMNEIKTHIEKQGVALDKDCVYAQVSTLIQASGENARTIKNKVQAVVEDMLFEKANIN